MTTTREEDLPQKASNYFFKLSHILGVIPPCSAAFGPNQKGIRNLYRVYAAFLILITVLITVITIVYRWRVIYPNFTSTTLPITDTFLDLSGAITNVVAIAVPTFGYFYNFQSFLQHFQKTHSLKQELIKMTEKRTFIFHFALGHAILFFIYAYEGYVWIVHWGWKAYVLYLFRHVQYYHIFITVLTINVFVSFLKSEFEYINRTLRHDTRGIPTNDEEILCVKEKIDYDAVSYSVQKLTRLYAKQITQVNLFNKIFGFQLLVLVLSFSTCLIHSINLLIVVHLESFSNSLKIPMILLNVIWTIWQLVLGSLAVSFCGSTEQESQETANVCLNLLTYLPLCTKEENNNNLRNELNLLTQLSSQKCPGFDAAGFFCINNALLLGIIGSVMSYVIVLVEFNKS